MSNSRLRRINKEIADCANDKASGIEVTMVDESPFHLVGTFPGPENSPYEGGVFDVDIVVPEQYPFQPVKMKFITKVYHPNISSASGAICLDILKDQWSPVLTLKSTLLSLRSLLCSPEPNDPQDAQVAQHYKADFKGFEETARYWTQTYADGSQSARPPAAGAGAKAPSSSYSMSSGTGANGTANGRAAPQQEEDPIEKAGLRKEHVEQFVGMGFPQEKVIEVLRRLNYRGANVRNISENTVIDALCS